MAVKATAARLDNYSCVVERYQSLIWSVAYAASGDPSLSDDIVQETFLAAWKQQKDLRDPSKMRAYLTSIARNLAITANTRMSRADVAAVSSDPRDRSLTPLETVLKTEQAAQAKCALSAIPQASREPFVLFYQEGHSVSRVAVDLGLSEAVVKQRLYRARESLKDSVAVQVGQVVKERAPGKTFTAAIMALIASQIRTSIAAAANAAAAKGAGELSPVPPLGELSPQVLETARTPGLVGSATAKLFILACALGTGLVFWMHNEVEASGESSLPSMPIVASQQPSPVTVSQHPSTATKQPQSTSQREPEIEVPLPLPVTLRLSEQPLITGRILQRAADADTDLNGWLSEEELAEFRTRQEEELRRLVRKNLDVVERTVSCSSVGVDSDGVFERVVEFNMLGYQDRYARLGAGQSVDEWLTSQLAASESGIRICYAVGDRFTDMVREARAEHETLKWQAAVDEGAHTVWIEVPKDLLGELTGASNEDEVAKIATRWGTQLAGVGIGLLGNPGQAPLHPRIRRAIDEGEGVMWTQYR